MIRVKSLASAGMVVPGRPRVALRLAGVSLLFVFAASPVVAQDDAAPGARPRGDKRQPGPIPKETFRHEVALRDARLQRALQDLGQAGHEAEQAEARADEAAQAHLDARRAVRAIDRRLEQLGEGKGRRYRRLKQYLATTNQRIEQLENALIEGEGPNADVRKDLQGAKATKNRVQRQIRLIEERNGVVARRKELKADRAEAKATLKETWLDKREARRALHRAWEAIDRAEKAVAEARLAYDRYVAMAPILLRDQQPPHLVSVRLKSLGIEYYNGTLIEPEKAHELWHRQLELANQLYEAQLEKVQRLRRKFRDQEKRLVEANERWQELNDKYEAQVHHNAFVDTLVDSIGSIQGVLSNPTPLQMLTEASVQLGLKIGDALYGAPPPYTDFPSLPQEALNARRGAAGNAAAEAALRLGLEDVAPERRDQLRAFLDTYREQVGHAKSAGSTDTTDLTHGRDRWDALGLSPDSLGTNAYRFAYTTVVKQQIDDAYKNAVDNKSTIRALKNAYLKRRNQKVHRLLKDAPGDVYARMRLGRQKVTRFVRENIFRGKKFPKDITQGFLTGLGANMAASVAKESGVRAQAEIFLQMFRQDMVWLYERKIYHYFARKLRVESHNLQAAREERNKLRAVRDRTSPLRQLKRDDRLLDSGNNTYRLTLEFSKPVRGLELDFGLSPQIYGNEIYKPTLTPENDSGSARKVHHYKLHLPSGPDQGAFAPQIRAPLRVTAEDTNGQQLDGDPYTVPEYSLEEDRWSNYETGADTTHNFKVGYTPERETPASLVLLIDGSSSMEGERLEEAKRVASQLLGPESPLGHGSEVACWTFNDGEPRLLHAFTQAPDELAEKINQLRAEGGTPLPETIRKAGHYLLRQSLFDKKILVVLSDGKVGDKASLQQAISQIQQSAVDVRDRMEGDETSLNRTREKRGQVPGITHDFKIEEVRAPEKIIGNGRRHPLTVKWTGDLNFPAQIVFRPRTAHENLTTQTETHKVIEPTNPVVAPEAIWASVKRRVAFKYEVVLRDADDRECEPVAVTVRVQPAR